MTHKWSGVGGMHIGWKYALEALEAELGISLRFQLHSMFDYNPICQELLKSLKPLHIFKDVTWL